MIHINIPKGHYIGQVRKRGYKTWRSVSGECKTDTAAMALAVLAMTKDDIRARVLFVFDSGYYGDSVVMECRR